MAKEFRKALNEFLSDISIAELQYGLPRKFDPNFLFYEEGEIDFPTMKLFEQASLDPKKPYHWQILLSFVALAIHSERTGRKTFWNREREEKLFQAVMKVRRAERKSEQKERSVEAICKKLKTTPAYARVSSDKGLLARFNIVLSRKRREAKKQGSISPLKRDLAWFDPS